MFFISLYLDFSPHPVLLILNTYFFIELRGKGCNKSTCHYLLWDRIPKVNQSTFLPKGNWGIPGINK